MKKIVLVRTAVMGHIAKTTYNAPFHTNANCSPLPVDSRINEPLICEPSDVKQ